MYVNEWTMFGFSHFFGDILDLINDKTDRLARVVVNVLEVKVPGRPSLEDRLSRLPYEVRVVPLSEFQPERGELYVMGFSGKKMEPLRNDLKTRFGTKFDPLVHSKAIRQIGSSIGEGTIVDAGAIMGPWAEAGKHVILNRGSNIGHDSKIGDYCFIAPSAVLCGHVVLGENVFIGAHATVIPDVKIGENSIVAAGSVVTRNVPPNVMVAGIPAVVKKNLNGP